MKRITLMGVLMVYAIIGKSQSAKPFVNIRLSFLIFPFSPLLTAEGRVIGNFTLQGETNFVNTHGVNLKYFLGESMNKGYVFVGTAFVADKFLRDDRKTTFIPYIGYGYAHRFGNNRNWTFDSRFGIGSSTNADKNSIYPILKTGIGRLF
jgi:hypothetical protein